MKNLHSLSSVTRTVVAVIGIGALVASASGCLLAAAGAIELDRQNHKAPPPPSTPPAPDAGGAPTAPAPNGTTSL